MVQWTPEGHTEPLRAVLGASGAVGWRPAFSTVSAASGVTGFSLFLAHFLVLEGPSESNWRPPKQKQWSLEIPTLS